jgi:hypothetical protein
MDRVPRQLDDLSGLSHEIYGVADEGREALIQVVAFAGEYGVGSGGNDDAAYMRGIVMAAISAWPTGCLVLDLRGLQYSWGSGLLTVIQAPHEFADEDDDNVFPVLVVGSADNLEALRGLLETADEDAGRWLFDSMETALEVAATEVERFVG